MWKNEIDGVHPAEKIVEVISTQLDLLRHSAIILKRNRQRIVAIALLVLGQASVRSGGLVM